MLYVLSASPYTKDIYALINIVQSKEDELLLLSDGIIAGLIGSIYLRILSKSQLIIYGLENDIIARGLSPYFSKTVIIIDYFGFVKLTEKHSNCITW